MWHNKVCQAHCQGLQGVELNPPLVLNAVKLRKYAVYTFRIKTTFVLKII